MRDTFRNSAHLTPNDVDIVWQAQSADTFPLEAKSHRCLRSGQIYDIKSTLGPSEPISGAGLSFSILKSRQLFLNTSEKAMLPLWPRK